MENRTRDIDTLLEMLSAVTKQSRTYTGLMATADLIREKFGNVFNQKYLYEKVYRSWKAANEMGSPVVRGLRLSNLDVLAKYLGYQSYQALVEDVNTQIDPTLQSCEGTYYSFVRMNHKNSVLLRSPVEIKVEGGKALWKLIGPERTYSGEIKLVAGCIFVLMTSSDGKQFHHVYRVGKRTSPKVLLGIFSGVSSGFVPIGGRVVLIKLEERIELLSTKQLTAVDLSASKALADRRLAEYFNDYDSNNLKMPEQMSYTIHDLGSCK